MDSREFAEWMQLDAIEPFGDDWLQAGTVAAVVYNSRPGVRAIKAGDFIPKAHPPQTSSDHEAAFRQKFPVSKGKSKRKSK